MDAGSPVSSRAASPKHFKAPQPEPCGTGKFVFADGSCYEGEWQSFGGVRQRHGRAVHEADDFGARLFRPGQRMAAAHIAQSGNQDPHGSVIHDGQDLWQGRAGQKLIPGHIRQGVVVQKDKDMLKKDLVYTIVTDINFKKR